MGEDTFKGFLDLGPIVIDVLTSSSLLRVSVQFALVKNGDHLVYRNFLQGAMADIKLSPATLSLISTIFHKISVFFIIFPAHKSFIFSHFLGCKNKYFADCTQSRGATVADATVDRISHLLAQYYNKELHPCSFGNNLDRKCISILLYFLVCFQFCFHVMNPLSFHCLHNNIYYFPYFLYLQFLLQ